MADGLVSIHGRKLALDVDGNLVIEGGQIIVNNGATPLRLPGGAASVAAGGTKTLTVAEHAGKEILLDTAAGSVVTLPPATGSKARIRFRVSVLATSNSHIVKVTTTDIMVGLAFGTRVDSGNAVLGFATAADSDTITLNRSTTGSVSLGEWIEVEDVATGVWHVKAWLSATGAAFATPFSATVS